VKNEENILLLVMVYEGFAQEVNAVPDMICLQELGGDTVCQENLKLLKQRGLLSDCEFGIKNANDDFNKQDYAYYSEEIVGSNLYCSVLERDYGIKWRFHSDLFSVEYYRCYNKEMSRLLIQKYGFNIFRKTAEKVNSFSEIKPASDSCYEYSCIPDFIRKKEKVYIHDLYIKDPAIFISKYKAIVCYQKNVGIIILCNSDRIKISGVTYKTNKPLRSYFE